MRGGGAPPPILLVSKLEMNLQLQLADPLTLPVGENDQWCEGQTTAFRSNVLRRLRSKGYGDRMPLLPDHREAPRDAYTVFRCATNSSRIPIDDSVWTAHALEIADALGAIMDSEDYGEYFMLALIVTHAVNGIRRAVACEARFWCVHIVDV